MSLNSLVQIVFQLLLTIGAKGSLEERYSTIPLAGVQPASSAIPAMREPFIEFLAAAYKEEQESMIESPFKTREFIYDHHKLNQLFIGPSYENPSLDGFTKQHCYPNTDPTDQGEEYCVFANPTFGDHRGMVLYIRPTYLQEKLDSLKVFQHDSDLITAQDRLEFPYKLVHMPLKGGLGAIAKRKINVGELVLKDYSLVVIAADLSEMSLEEWAPRFKFMVDLLPFKGRELFAKQHGVGDDELSWITSAFQRNVFSAPQDDNQSGGCAFAPEPAYLNHDCRPNTAYKFNNETLEVEMRALREIAPGEELTVSYIKLIDSRENRRKSLLHSYGFHCGCSQCSLADSESEKSDRRLEKLVELWEQVSEWESDPTISPADVEDLIELFKQERLDVVMEEPYTMASLVYNSWGLTHEARRYAALGVSFGVHTHDKTWLDSSSHLPLIYDPEHHWSYNIRKEVLSRQNESVVHDEL